jgi:hypothetical protein
VLRTPSFCIAVAAILVSPRAYADLPRGTEIRAYLNESCIVSDEPYLLAIEKDDQFIRSLALSGVVVSKLAHTFLGGLVRATSAQLGSMSRSRDMNYVAAKDFDLYRATLSESPGYELNNKLACATIVAADFKSNNVDCTQDYDPRVLSEVTIDPDDFASRAIREDNSVENILRRANVCVRGQAHSIYEVRFEYSDDRTAYRLESAGLWVNSLLSTKSRKASRGIVYTMDISEPTADSDTRVLSSAWVNIGEVKAGYASENPLVKGRSEWLRVPSMSDRAYRAYQNDTSIHQDVFGEIQALQRSVTRDKRQRDGMQRRLAAASANIKGSIQSEIDSLELRILRAESLLEARRAEYEDLPSSSNNYMPVTIRFGIIESRSEKRALGALAAFLKNNSSRIADTATGKKGLERSVDGDVIAMPEDQHVLEQARTDYFDALIAFRESSDNAAAVSEQVEQNLTLARETYNAARAAAGISPVQ